MFRGHQPLPRGVRSCLTLRPLASCQPGDDRLFEARSTRHQEKNLRRKASSWISKNHHTPGKGHLRFVSLKKMPRAHSLHPQGPHVGGPTRAWLRWRTTEKETTSGRVLARTSLVELSRHGMMCGIAQLSCQDKGSKGSCLPIRSFISRPRIRRSQPRQ